MLSDMGLLQITIRINSLMILETDVSFVALKGKILKEEQR